MFPVLREQFGARVRPFPAFPQVGETPGGGRSRPMQEDQERVIPLQILGLDALGQRKRAMRAGLTAPEPLLITIRFLQLAVFIPFTDLRRGECRSLLNWVDAEELETLDRQSKPATRGSAGIKDEG